MGVLSPTLFNRQENERKEKRRGKAVGKQDF
jgi:hypothetical protein